MKRKMCKDFDPTKEYSVDVEDCTEVEKKEVQQAFFDVGILWQCNGAKYGHLGAVQYTNKYEYGDVSAHYLYEGTAEGSNMTAKEFLDLVYEPENQGHVHAELMLQYAEDAKTSKTPWELWEYLDKDDGWTTFKGAPGWYETSVYRRKPKTHFVHGVEIPDLRVSPKYGEYYYFADPTERDFTYYYLFHGDGQDNSWVERGLVYQNTEEGKQAAILHAKAMLGIA